MILYAILTAIIAILNAVTFFLHPITELPFNMDTYLTQFANVTRAVLEVLPFLTIPLATVTLFYGLVVARFGWTQIKWLIERIH